LYLNNRLMRAFASVETKVTAKQKVVEAAIV
jgi:hypothetical protein